MGILAVAKLTLVFELGTRAFRVHGYDGRTRRSRLGNGAKYSGYMTWMPSGRSASSSGAGRRRRR